ncbi:TPR-like protein [Wilcoxina mikolae CBS 423.85]|nr:TPR-like protein [Wilcoxina mikolae CBS 423.85]
MAKTRPSKTSSPSTTSSSKKSKRQKSLLNKTGSFSSAGLPPSASEDIPTLLSQASEHLHARSEPSQALTLATRALNLNPTSLQTLELLAEIHVELADTETAYTLYKRAATLDPSGLHETSGGSGPEKFLWLAQLCPSGGAEAVGWYEKGAATLREFIKSRDAGLHHNDLSERGLEKKLVSALCGMAEIYMTDLCMSPDAESRCEGYVTEAILVSPESPEALQTLASVRISQQRMGDAVSALERAFGGWKDVEKEDEMPSYAVRISLARLLIECAQYETAIEVLERLQAEDDQLPDLWYLGGWTLFLLGERERGRVEGWVEFWEAAREWLRTCEQLYKALEWEDEGIKEHASELLAKIAEIVPETPEKPEDEEEGGEDDDDWESDSEEEDEEMKDS